MVGSLPPKVEQPEGWCNTHQRPAELCKIRGGILLPCRVVDLKGIMEIEYEESWRDELADALDDACAIDVSANDIDRSPKPWWGPKRK